jgi:hypothetical protein
MIDHIQISCGIGAIGSPMIIYEDNATYVAQMQIGYIKTNYTEHISLKLFYPHELQESGDIRILQIKSCDDLIDLFTMSLPLATFDKCVKDIGMRIQRFARLRITLISHKNQALEFSYKFFEGLYMLHGQTSNVQGECYKFKYKFKYSNTYLNFMDEQLSVKLHRSVHLAPI